MIWRRPSSIAAIQAVITEMPELEPAVQGSVSPVVALLNEHFSCMKLKGSLVIARQAAAKDEVLDNFESVRFIDPSQDTLKKSEGLQAFMKAHCSATHYLFQIKKCGNASCSYCSLHPLHLPEFEFDRLNFVPLPLMNQAKDHYQKFEELNGKPPSEADRPSLSSSSSSEAKEIDTKNLLLPKYGTLSCVLKVRSHVACMQQQHLIVMTESS